MWTNRLAYLSFFALCAAAHAPDARAQADGPPAFAFPVERVTFSNGPVTLSGGLLMPSAQGGRTGPFPAVVMIHGAGPATFDEPGFRVHANAFVRAGFAVLLYDKRGSGESTGDLDTSDYDDLAADVAAAVRFLRARAEIVPGKVGLLGRSEGGWTGTLAAGRDRSIAFMIMSSGSAVAPFGQTLFQTRNALRARGATPDEVQQGAEAKAALWAYYREVATNPSWGRSEAGRAAREIVERRLKAFERFAPAIPQRVADPIERTPAFFQAFTRKMYFEPEAAFRALRAPLLEVIGALDDVVEPASTIAELERLRGSGLDVTIRVLPNLDHTLLVKTAAGVRYPEDYPEFAVRWAREKVERTPKPGTNASATPGVTRALGYYDSTLKRVVLLGSAGDLKATSRDRVWSWSGTRWEPMAGPGPRSRGNAGAAYDARRRVAIVAGGFARAANDASFEVVGDSWLGRKGNWQGIRGTDVTARDHQSMVFDERRAAVLLFGGIPRGRATPWPADTWEFKPGGWTRIATEGPAGRARSGLVYDKKRGHVVLFGGVGAEPAPGQPQPFFNDTWVLERDTWRKVAEGGPRARYAHGMVFDERAGVVWLYSGAAAHRDAPLSDMWQWDGTRWTEVQLTGRTPGYRYQPIMVYDRARGKTVLYGGLQDAKDDTWEWDGREWREVRPPT